MFAKSGVNSDEQKTNIEMCELMKVAFSTGTKHHLNKIKLIWSLKVIIFSTHQCGFVSHPTVATTFYSLPQSGHSMSLIYTDFGAIFPPVEVGQQRHLQRPRDGEPGWGWLFLLLHSLDDGLKRSDCRRSGRLNFNSQIKSVISTAFDHLKNCQNKKSRPAIPKVQGVAVSLQN